MALNAEKDPYSHYQQRYEEHRRLIQTQDTKHPSIKQCAWKSYTKRFVIIHTLRRYATISPRLFNDMHTFHLDLPDTRVVQ